MVEGTYGHPVIEVVTSTLGRELDVVAVKVTPARAARSLAAVTGPGECLEPAAGHTPPSVVIPDPNEILQKGEKAKPAWQSSLMSGEHPDQARRCGFRAGLLVCGAWRRLCGGVFKKGSAAIDGSQ
jgi:hypothetical protein